MRYRFFEKIGFIAWPPHHKIKSNNDHVLMGHFEDTLKFNQRWMELGKVFPAFVPLRHPARSLLSMKARHVPPHVYDHQWQSQLEFGHKFISTMYIHLDDKEIRERQLIDMLEFLGHEPWDFDWSVDEKETGSKKKTHDAEITEELLKEVPQEYIDFYEEMKQ